VHLSLGKRCLCPINGIKSCVALPLFILSQLVCHCDWHCLVIIFLQYLSNLFLKVSTVSACTTEGGRLFHNSTTLSEKRTFSSREKATLTFFTVEEQLVHRRSLLHRLLTRLIMFLPSVIVHPSATVESQLTFLTFYSRCCAAALTSSP